MSGDMTLLRKPQHPTYDACSRQDCQTMVDVASVKTIGLITNKFEDKLRDAVREQNSNTELKLKNAVLTVKDELHQELRQLTDNTHVEIRKVLDERLTFMSTQLERNSKAIDELQADVAKIKSESRNQVEKDEKDLRSVQDKLRLVVEESATTKTNLEHLTANVRKLFDEFNKRS